MSVDADTVKKFIDDMLCTRCGKKTNGCYFYTRVVELEDGNFERTDRMVPMCDPCAARLTEKIDDMLEAAARYLARRRAA